MCRSFFFIFFLLSLFLLTSCSLMGGSTPGKYQRYVGTEGLTISFLKNAPPDTVYEGRLFPVRFELANKGAQNVTYDRVIISFSYDPLYLSTTLHDPSQQPAVPNKYPLSLQELPTQQFLSGRSEFFPKGDSRLYSVPTEDSFTTKMILGQRERPQTTLSVTACYSYMTYAAAEVCIDTNLYGQNERKQSCTSKDLTLSGGQGAPIAVTKIEITSLPVISDPALTGVRRESIKPQFTIHFQNVGTGYLIGPDTLPLADACLLRKIPKEQTNTIRVQASLFKTRLVCGYGTKAAPEAYVRLEDGVGSVVCTVPDDDLSNPLYASTQNFMTMLTVNASYLYRTSASKELTIERNLAIRPVEPTGTELGKVTGYAYDAAGELRKTPEGRPITLCSWYQDNPSEAPAPIQERLKELNSSGLRMSCACDLDRCVKLSRDSASCFYGLCDSGRYCCTDVPKDAKTQYSMYVPEQDLSLEIAAIGPNPSYAQVNAALESAAVKFGVPTDVLKAIAYKESRWKNTANGDSGRSWGIMQIYSVAHPKYTVENGRQEAAYNIQYGTQFLRYNYDRSNDWRTAVRMYNGAGPAAEAYAADIMVLSQSRPWIREFKLDTTT